MKRLLFLLATAAFAAGCASKEAPVVSSGPAAESAPSSAGAKSVDPATAGTVSGRIVFEGPAPEPKQLSVKGNPECAALHAGGTIASEELVVQNGVLQNVLVYIKEGLEGYAFTAPQTPHVIHNKECVYVPHVSAAMAGQPVEFVNDDSTLHNVHSYPKNSKPFNLGLPLVGMKQTKKIDMPEVAVQLKCDVHPWMLGYLAVLPHPYFQVSLADGSFQLANLPPGSYTVEAWHETLGAQTQQVTVATGQTQSIEFKFTG